MLTPQEITDKKFQKAVFGGYDMTEVDDFLALLGTDYTSLYKENAILKGKLKVLVEKVEEYRTTEDAMRMALLTAQRTGDEIMSDANKRKEELLREIEEERQEMLSQVAKRVADEQRRLQTAAKETSKFIELSQAIMKKHSEFLSKLESAKQIVLTAAKPAQAEAPPKTQEAPPTREQQISQSAAQIGDAMNQLTGNYAEAPRMPLREKEVESAPEPPIQAHKQQQQNYTDFDAPTRRIGGEHEPPAGIDTYDDFSEPTKMYTSAAEKEDPLVDEEDLSPRPKFDFDNLKFGPNFKTLE